MNNELMTINRADNKNAVKLFKEETRVAIDKAVVLLNDFSKAHGEEATRLTRAQAVAAYNIAQEKEAMEKAGFDTFGKAVEALIGLKASNASQYKRAAEMYICRKDAPAIKDWYGPSTLYLFAAAKVSDETINKGIADGKLTDKTTQDAVKAWIASLASEAISDGESEAELAKLYDADITIVTLGGTVGIFKDSLYGVTMDELKAALVLDGDHPESDDYYSAFNPHAELTRMSKTGKAKTITGKGIFYRSIDVMAIAVYFPTERTKTAQSAKHSATDATIAAQNKTIAELMAKLKALEAKQG